MESNPSGPKSKVKGLKNPEYSDFLVYLMSPYKCNNPELSDKEKARVEFGRYSLITQFAAHLTNAGVICYSPITHSHPQNAYLPPERKTWKVWGRVDLSYLKRADQAWLVKYDGWDTSNGVAHELLFCRKHDIPIREIGVRSTITSKEGDITTTYGTDQVDEYIRQFGVDHE